MKLYIQWNIPSVAALFEEYKKQETAAGWIPFESSKFHEKFKQKNLAIYIPLVDRCGICEANEQEPRADFEAHRREVDGQRKYAAAIKKRGRDGFTAVNFNFISILLNQYNMTLMFM